MAIKFQGFTGGGGAAVGGLTYKGTFNATAGTPDISSAIQGDLYVIDVAGTIYGQTWAINDHLLVNADMGGVISNSKIDKVDNTSDTSLQIGSNLGDLGNLATAQGNLNLKTAAYEDVGTTAGDVVQLDGTAKLPAVDGSALTNLPSALVSSVNTATGAVNIYADDSTLNIDGTALTLTGTGATSTLNVDVGTTANKIVQLDGTAKLPAVDGSALTNLPSAPVTSVNTATGAVVLDTDDIAEATNLYFTTGRVDTQVATLPMSTMSDVAYTAGAGIDNYVLTYDHSSTSWGAEASAGGGAVSSVNGATGAVNIYADDSTLNIDGTALTLSGTGATSTLNVDVGTTANKIVQLDGTAKLPAVDGSALTNLPSAPVTSVNTATGAVNIYADDSTLNIDGTALTLSGTGATSTLNVDVGTTANKIVQLDGTAKLPAVDGSALTNLPTAPVTSVNTATGAVNIYADDSTLNIDGTALTLSGTGATSTLNVDVGTTANKIVQLDGTAKLPAVDGSALTNLPSAPVSSVNTATGAVVLDTDDIAEGANLYFTTGRVDTQVATLPMSTLSDVAYTAGAGIDNYVLTYDHSSTSWGAEASAGGGAVSSVNGATGAVNIYADDSTLNIDGTALTLSGTGATSTLNVDVGTTANKIVQLDGTAKLPAVDGSALTNLPAAPVSSVNTATGAVVLDTDDIAEGANLYFTTARVDTQVATLPMSTLLDVAYTAGAGIDNYVLTYDHSSTSWGAEASAGGGGGWTYNAITSASSPVTSAISNHYGADSSVGVITFNLPALSGLTGGEEIRVKLNTAGNNLNVTPNGADTIDGSVTAYALSIALSSITLVASSGTNWEIV